MDARLTEGDTLEDFGYRLPEEYDPYMDLSIPDYAFGYDEDIADQFGTAAYADYDIFGDDDMVSVYWTTNDNLDRGSPSEFADDTYTFERRGNKTAIERALAFTGTSRQGVGQEVTVWLNGERI